MSDTPIDSKVAINCKSGSRLVRWFKKFKVETRGTAIVGYEYTLAKGEKQIIYLNVDNIESIEVLDTRNQKV